MSEGDTSAATAAPDIEPQPEPRTVMDADDRLRPEFVAQVLDAVAAGDNDTARALVGTAPSRRHRDLSDARRGRAGGAGCGACRDCRCGRLRELKRACPRDSDRPRWSHAGRRLAGQLDTDDAVRSSRISTATSSSGAVAMERTIARRSRKR